MVDEVEQPSNNKQNPVADDSHDQDSRGAAGSVEGKLLIRSNGVWHST